MVNPLIILHPFYFPYSLYTNSLDFFFFSSTQKVNVPHSQTERDRKEEIYLIKSMHTHPLYYVCAAAAVAAKQRKQINFDVCSHVNLPPSPLLLLSS